MDQIEIKGKVNTAICYARVVEEEAIEQIRRMCDYPMTEGSRIRIMPDVHAGKGCTCRTRCPHRRRSALPCRGWSSLFRSYILFPHAHPA